MGLKCKYSTPTSLALLQVFVAMVDGDEMTFEYFNELTGLGKTVYKEVMKLLNELTEDLHMRLSLFRYSTDITTEQTKYSKYTYKFICNYSLKFSLPEDLSDEKKVKYSAVIIYLKLRFNQYVCYRFLAQYFPDFTRRKFNYLIKAMQNVIDDEIYKDELQSYALREFED